MKCYVLAGCCISCVVHVKSRQLRQPEALGISAEMKFKVCAFYFRFFLIFFYHSDIVSKYYL